MPKSDHLTFQSLKAAYLSTEMSNLGGAIKFASPSIVNKQSEIMTYLVLVNLLFL